MDEVVVKQALVGTAMAVLTDAGIEIDVEAGVISWPDPAAVPFQPRPIDPNRLLELARAVRAARMCWQGEG